MDGIPPSICPTGIYRPPSCNPASAGAPERSSIPRNDTPPWIVRILDRLGVIAQRVLGRRRAPPTPINRMTRMQGRGGAQQGDQP